MSSRARGLTLTVMAALAALGALPVAGARASAYSDVLRAYQRAGTGSIPPCEFSPAELSAALKGVDTYDTQYFQDFTNAVQTALSQRASGVCSAHPAAFSEAGGQSGASSIVPGSSVPGTSSAGLPLPLVLMAVLAALAGAGATTVATSRARGWDPSWLQAWRHSWREAGYRTAALLAEFRDWLRSAP